MCTMGAMAEEKSVPALVWSKERHTPKRQVLSVERIVEVSIGIADSEGLDALSMRRVATDLRSGTTSLYRYVTGRDELLELMIDTARAAAAPEPLTGAWRTDLADVARGQRTALLRHPWLGSVLASRPALGPNSLRQMDHALAAVGAATEDITLASDVVSLVFDYVIGVVSRELAEQEAQRRTGMTEEQWRSSVSPYIHRIVESGAYPQFARRVIEAEDHGFDHSFEFGLACLLDGIATRVGHQPPDSDGRGR